MKISIWQQFSSNHSGAFTVVGLFSDEQIAIAAEASLNSAISSIAKWYENSIWTSRNRKEPTPPEVALARKYQVYWPRPVRWVVEHDPDALTVKRSGTAIYLDCFTNTFQGPQPFDALLERLGAQVFVAADSCSDFDNQFLAVHLECDAPSTEQADWTHLFFQDYLDSSETRHVLYEWINKWDDPYRPGDRHYNAVEQSGCHLTFSNLWLNDVTYLPKLIDYLAQQGCNRFTYSFTEIRRSFE